MAYPAPFFVWAAALNIAFSFLRVIGVRLMLLICFAETVPGEIANSAALKNRLSQGKNSAAMSDCICTQEKLVWMYSAF
jgi:hypothetical protein